MRNFKRQITAILTAAVMTFSAAAGTVYAQDEQQEEAPKYTGWVTSGEYWQYIVDGEPYSGSLKIDDVLCNFSLKGCYTGTYSGWKNNRCYKDGLPYTGWSETKDGRKYCLDGYAVTGEFPVNGEIYTFSGKGICKESRTPVVSVTCGERVCTDTEKIKITLENLDGKSHEFKIAKSFEYFKDGEWVSCKSTNSYVPLGKGISQKGEKLTFEADVSEYSRNKFNVGFYRLPIISGEETYYAVFEVVSPIELKSRKDEYVFANNVKTSGGTVKLDMIINSDKKDMQAESIANNISVKLEKQSENGWSEIVNDIPWEIGYTDNGNRLEIAPELSPEEGYYRVTATVGKKNYTDTFRVRNHIATAWLDEYDLNSKNLTISFTVMNCGGEPIKICTFPYGLYQKNPDGTWRASDVEGAAVEISESAYTTLNGGKSTTVNFDISNYYNMSELKAGEYAVDIGGIGRAEFTLTDKPAEKNLPFKDIKAEDIKEIQIVDSHIYITETVNIKHGNSVPSITDETDENDWRKITSDVKSTEYIELIAGYLRQFELKDKKAFEVYMGGEFYITVTLKDGTKTTVEFDSYNVATYNGKMYYCSEYADNAIQDIHEKLVARNLPFDDIYENEPVQIQLKNIDGGRIITAKLYKNDDDFHSQVVSAHYFELKDVLENYEIPTGGAFQVILVYKDGNKQTLTFYESDIVMMPDGKVYRCYSSSYYDGLLEIFGKLEHSVSNIEPDDTLEEDTT